ncbi:RNA methyltransferase [Romeria aff. gracilis LEGE 07310]|uniref:RNA methyltransferase n=1 Tax=Vasconcelosia minhoensis LEGE 07310 TaxID=915328 RepID=A0A8J7AA18_9CYAN|nr:RNA methyltransferase [Romeria gracilis]MBE9076856.1 RNA methyltransferase [Romeria aff. gracilis LEGE 07310]
MTFSDHLPRHGLIVCASLVQNSLNLGGLCRTAEVFRLECLVLPDLAMAESWTFRQVAVSAQRWQPLATCPPEQLASWLIAQKARGYRLVGLSPRGQHDLPAYEFRQKSVLLLGRELTGIPPELEQCCDDAIAIPQFGQVASLNVHTAAAIAIYEYIRQHSD